MDDDQMLVALTPAELAPAQAELSAWCDRKLAAVKTELSDLETNLELATEHGWKYRSVEASLNRTQKRIHYYEKLKSAVAAGYLLIPNLPVDLIAVRVSRSKQRQTEKDHEWGGFSATPELLPEGEGRYVDEKLTYTDASFVEKVDGKDKTIRRFVSADYDDVDFPVTTVKPMVLEATMRAMAAKIFDQIGLVQNQSGRDPIVVGQLLDPRGSRRLVTFFIAWWLDTSTL